MITAKFSGSSITRAYGLTKWDYGQELELEYAEMDIPDGTEVHFYQGEKLSSTAYLKNRHVMIPDPMLQSREEITAYVYVRSEAAGKTVLSILLPVRARPKPDNYVLPEYEEYKRLLPEGGESGQVPVKSSSENYAVRWGYRADSASYDGEYLQLMSGKVPVGDRIRVMKEEREIELTNDGEYIKWRYTDSNEWHNLAALDSLKGPPGVTPEFELRDGHLIVKYNE